MPLYFSHKHQNLFFYFILFLGFIALLYTTPFLRYPYDMFHHLIVIDDIYMQIIHPVKKMAIIWGNGDTLSLVPTGIEEPIKLLRPRYLWHYLWAYLFYWLNIDSPNMFLRAQIIHVIQTIISLASVYYFSNVILRNLFKDIPKIKLRWLSLWSVIIWLTVFATFSAAYHQVWILWYSINYQITLPLFWYMLGLSLVLFLENTSWKIKVFFVLQILFLTRFMLQVHSMEFLYYLMHMGVFSLVFIDKIFLFAKKYFYLLIPLILAVLYMFTHYLPEKSLLFDYLSWEKLPELHQYIMQAGAFLISGHNRAYASINELMYLVLFLAVIFILYFLWQYFYKKEKIMLQWRVLIFILFTSLFVLIPLYQFSGGLFSVITRMLVVNRLYYSSSLFILIPIIAYYIFKNYPMKYTHLFIFLSLLLTVIVSKYSDYLHHNYYKNIVSIRNSFDQNKIGFNLSSQQIKTIEDNIYLYEKNNQNNHKIIYFAREDIAFVLKYFFHKNTYWRGRGANPDYLKMYQVYKKNKKYYPILFKVPKGFPQYQPYR